MIFPKINMAALDAQLIFLLTFALAFGLTTIFVILATSGFFDHLGPNGDLLIALFTCFIYSLVFVIMQGYRIDALKAVLNPTGWPSKSNPGLFWGVLGLLSLGLAIGSLIEFLPGYQEMAATYHDLFADDTLAIMILGCSIFPFLEELIFRGVLFGGLLKRGSFWSAAVISSLLFGLIHGNMLQFIDASIGGFAYAWIYYRHRSLWVPILAHVFNNILASILPGDWRTIFGDVGLIMIALGAAVLCYFIWTKYREEGSLQ